MSDTGNENGDSAPGERPPVFSSWNGWYATLIGTLALLVILFTLMRNHFSR